MVIKIMDMRKILNQIRVFENCNTVQAEFKSFKIIIAFVGLMIQKG